MSSIRHLLTAPVPCDKAIESRTHVVGGCAMCEKERDVLEEMRKIDECGTEKLGTPARSEKNDHYPRRCR